MFVFDTNKNNKITFQKKTHTPHRDASKMVRTYDPSCLCGSLEDQTLAFGVLFVWVTSKTLQGFHEFPSVNGQAFKCSFPVVSPVWLHVDQEEEIPATAVEYPMCFFGELSLRLRPQEQFVVLRRGTDVSYRTCHTLQTFVVGRIGRPSIVRAFSEEVSFKVHPCVSFFLREKCIWRKLSARLWSGQ